MPIPNSEIKKVKDILEVSTEENYLRMILDSYYRYNHRARLDIAELVYEKFKSLSDTPENDNLKRSLAAEMYSKLMQVVEDSALMFLMFTTKGKTPIEVFMDIENQMLYEFFGRAKRGTLGDRAILKAFGLKPAKELLEAGLIDQLELKDFERVLKQLINGTSQVAGEKYRWKGLGRLYTKEFREPKGQTFKIKRTKSSVIRVYFNLKHNFKVLLPSPVFYKIWPSADSSLSLDVVKDYQEFGKLVKKVPNQLKQYEQTKMVLLGGFPVSFDVMTKFYERIFPQAQEIRMMADYQLRLLDDPSVVVRDIRFIIYMQSGKAPPKPHRKCICGSNKKFRNCHGTNNPQDDNLVFNRLKYETIQAPKTRLLKLR